MLDRAGTTINLDIPTHAQQCLTCSAPSAFRRKNRSRQSAAGRRKVVEGQVRFGLCAVLLGGILQGSVFLPMKFTQRWQWENIWACFSTVAYLCSPWFLACLLVPHFPTMLTRGQPWHLSVNLIIRRRNGSGSSHDGLGIQVCRDGYHLRDCSGHIVPRLARSCRCLYFPPIKFENTRDSRS